MTLFEKIYLSLFVLNFVLLFCSLCDEYDEHELWKPFVIQVGLTFLYLFVKLILFIWDVNIDLFPSVSVK